MPVHPETASHRTVDQTAPPSDESGRVGGRLPEAGAAFEELGPVEASEKLDPAMRATNTTLHTAEAPRKPRTDCNLFSLQSAPEAPCSHQKQASLAALHQLSYFLELARQLQDLFFSMHSLHQKVELSACIEELTRLIQEELDREVRHLEEGFLSRNCEVPVDSEWSRFREFKHVSSFGHSLSTTATFAKQQSLDEPELDSPLLHRVMRGGLASHPQFGLACAPVPMPTPRPCPEHPKRSSPDAEAEEHLSSTGGAEQRGFAFGASARATGSTGLCPKAEPSLAYDYSEEQYLRSYFSSLSLLGEKKFS